MISKVNYRKLNTDDKLLNYGCFLCRVREMSWAGIVDHWSSRLHCANLSTQNSTIKCIDELDFEEAHEMVATNISQLQYELDRCFKTLVGIEYCLDIRNELNQTLFYQCLLCDNSIIDTLSLIEHLTTTEHRMNFLVSR